MLQVTFHGLVRLQNPVLSNDRSLQDVIRGSLDGFHLMSVVYASILDHQKCLYGVSKDDLLRLVVPNDCVFTFSVQNSYSEMYDCGLSAPVTVMVHYVVT